MEDLDDSQSPIVDNMPEPQGNDDPDDPLQPDIEEEHEPNAPIADPTADPDALEDDALDEQPDPDGDPALDVDPDDESELDELDEAQFDNFDPDAANIVVPSAPVAVDETNVGQLGVHKRKRTEEEERERKKKKKEGRRERVSKKNKKTGDVEDDAGDGETGRRARNRTSKPAKRQKTPEDEDLLTPEERRSRALDRKMDEALRSSKPTRRRGGGIDVVEQGETELEQIRVRMASAAAADSQARKRDEPASHKLKMLSQVVELLNRNTLRQSILDPEINVLQAVRFWLEPADEDAALPNYQIQRELFSIMAKLNMTKEALIASGIGKVVMYYTKSTQPQPAIKRMAEKLLQSWMAIVLNKRRTGRSEHVEKRSYDPLLSSQRVAASQFDKSAMLAEKRRKQLALPSSRARIEGGLKTYTIAPVNNRNDAMRAQRRGGEDLVKKIAARAQDKANK